MKISIDTKEDSPAEIQKVIELLQSILTQQPSSSSYYQEEQKENQPKTQPITDFTSIFQNTQKPLEQRQEEQPKKEEENSSDDMFKILPY